MKVTIFMHISRLYEGIFLSKHLKQNHDGACCPYIA